jgi:hypothetical protein
MGWARAALTPAMASSVAATVVALWAAGMAAAQVVAAGLVVASLLSAYTVRYAGLKLARTARELRELTAANLNDGGGFVAVDSYAGLLHAEAAARQLAATWPLALGTGGLAGIPLSIAAYSIAYSIQLIMAQLCQSATRLPRPIAYSVAVIASWGLASILLYPLLRGEGGSGGCRLQGEDYSSGSRGGSVSLPAGRPENVDLHG